MNDKEISNNRIKNKQQCLWALCAFALSTGLYLIILFILGITPFGEKTMIMWDMDMQYTSFYVWFSEALKGQTPFFFSLRGGLGENMMGLYAYYLASPLNIILIFFNVNTIRYGIMILLILKTGLSASSMSVYLGRRGGAVETILFSCFYALSSYVICFQNNLMWMDAYILFPIIVLGIEIVIEKSDFRLYVVSLALCIYSNYYFGYMVCIFCALYYFVFYYTSEARRDIRRDIIQHLKFASYSILSAGICAVILLPAIQTLSNSSADRIYKGKQLMDMSTIIDPRGILQFVFAGARYTAKGNGGFYPMMYVGSVTFVLAIAFLLSRGIKTGEKIRYAILLGILLFGMIFKGPYFIWHGMTWPSGCQERFAFMWLFLVLVMAHRISDVLKEGSKIPVIIALGLEAVCLIIVFLQNGFRISYPANAVCSILSILALVVYKRTDKRWISLSAVILIFAVCGSEIIYNAVKLHEDVFEGDYVTVSDYDRNTAGAGVIKGYFGPDDTLRHRTVVLDGRLGGSMNMGYNYSFNSLNTYSSTEDTRPWEIYRILGMGNLRRESDTEFDQNASDLAADILGIKYVIAGEGMKGNYDILINDSGTCLYVNEDALPVIYPVNDGIFNVDGSRNVFDRLNDVFNSIGSRSEDTLYVITDNAEIPMPEIDDPGADGNTWTYKLDDDLYCDGRIFAIENTDLLTEKMREAGSALVKLEISGNRIVAEAEMKEPGYLCASIINDPGWSAYVDGAKTQIVPVLGGMMAFPADKGHHVIELRYIPAGLYAGVIISIISLMTAVVLAFGHKRAKKMNETR